MEHWETIAAERLALADLLARLTPEQWATASLCGGWTVREVVAHLVMPIQTSMPRGVIAFSGALLASRGNFARANVALAAKGAKQSTTELVAALRSGAEHHFTPPGFGSEAPLTDVLVHGQDIRIPLGLVNDRPIDPWRVVLEFLVTPKARRGFAALPTDGLRFVATDLDWSHGSGNEVRGPAIALALAILGRNARIQDLTGPGTTTLTARIPA